ncbi:sulfide:quinone oxidoreductase, mitochondrial-like [Stegodyphus dumicola]|uniref:sulfide:quinone oxidoreductase, mitochondrial-like n=1 Tax=Stegodyphus dumicola TaxID=202533 RepID=UPI0015B36F80|nr:sulfide:quinone oxidoreductase, mitochondrial-like [Stegodyphus dumicola]XP_035226022.1 sulfide:quinone oxidoreductase, mitochondrial-like [Stegodyphus dumicola]XP_035226023.1 sulfide:quinone oxidoreductase, mitochondrial-like [Stegodyphus dumicola]
MAKKFFPKLLTVYCQETLIPCLSRATFATSNTMQKQTCKFLIAGGGTGGITMASRILRLGEKDVTVIEPSENHYYQPYWTLIGGQKKSLPDSCRPTSSVMPRGVNWVKDKIVEIDPLSNSVCTANGRKIEYSYLVVALGLHLAFEKIKGLPAAFESKGVCSNYSSQTVRKTAQALDDFVKGNAIFTQPVNPIKCAGAPQKIMYLAEEYFSKKGKRADANIIFNTALPTIFSCPKYAAALREVAKSKNITVNYFHSLVEVKADSKEAVFAKLNEKGKTIGTEIFPYEMLHVVPPMIAPSVIANSPLADPTGFMDVHQNTLQSMKFPNVFGIGDCINVPTSKTAAAVAAQCGVLTKNIKQVFKGKEIDHRYFGYTACPLVTGYNKGIMAEFNYKLEAVETLPINQAKERYISYYMKKDLMPFIYWNLMLKGLWPGPGPVRKLLHLGFSS